MSKVFISQAMKYRPLDEILKEREDIIVKVHELYPNESIEIIDSVIVESEDVEFKSVDSEDGCVSAIRIESQKPFNELLKDADIAVFAGDWRNHEECSVDRISCDFYNVKVVEV